VTANASAYRELERNRRLQKFRRTTLARGKKSRPDIGRLFVSDGGGALRVFDSKTFAPLSTLRIAVDADRAGLLANPTPDVEHDYRRVRRHPDAAELAQEVYVRMLRVPDMGAIRNPEAYLYTVASNLAKEHARHEHTDAGVLDVDDPLVQEQLAELPAFAGDLDTEQRIKRLREVLHQLPPKCHAAVVLQYWHGLSYEEIAQRLGVSTHMVKKYLSQALVHCRRRMARLG